MKLKIALVVVAILALGLGVGLIKTNQQADKDRADANAEIGRLSNSWSETTLLLEDQKKKDAALEMDLTNKLSTIVTLTNSLLQANDTIKEKDAALKTAQEEQAQSQKQITELKTDIDQLDQQAASLTNQIHQKDQEITDTKAKLDSSEGDKVFLEKELQRLMAEKAELERKFSDLAVLKDQVKKLKEELDVSRRLQWIREGLFATQDQKGAQRLMQGAIAQNNKPAVAPTNAYDLNVEVKSDGSVQVIPPLPSTPAPGDSLAPPAGK
jgi:chromosome segregation ATPase